MISTRCSLVACFASWADTNLPQGLEGKSMPIDVAALAKWEFGEQIYTFTRRDTILYALGVGLGVPATDPQQLPFLYEKSLRALPTMAVMLGYRGFWMQDPATGIDWKRVLHSSQSITLHAALPIEGVVVSRQRIASLVDKGIAKGAVMVVERDVYAEDGQTLLAHVEQTSLLRGDGGFGQSFGSLRAYEEVPQRPPDRLVDFPTLEQAALLYRLSGDYNPLHADPEVAAAVGYPRPILHGLCTFGVVGVALLSSYAGWLPERIRNLRGRFSAAVFPGDTIRTEMWLARSGAIRLRARSMERDVVVFDQGYAEIADVPGAHVSSGEIDLATCV
jgi:acyl dehydratase